MWSQRKRVWAPMWERFKITLTHPGKNLLHKRWQHHHDHLDHQYYRHDHLHDHHHEHHDHHDQSMIILGKAFFHSCLSDRPLETERGGFVQAGQVWGKNLSSRSKANFCFRIQRLHWASTKSGRLELLQRSTPFRWASWRYLDILSCCNDMMLPWNHGCHFVNAKTKNSHICYPRWNLILLIALLNNDCVFSQENVKSFNIEDVATFDTVTKMKSEISNLRSDLVNQEKLTGED